jgi:tRNA/rRNA methyltransferase
MDMAEEGKLARIARQDDILRGVRFILVEPAHPGNIGSAARAIRTMGFGRLVVVRPHDPGWREHPEARALAAAAGDVLAAARLCDDLPEALEGVHAAFAMTGYQRDFGPGAIDLRQAATGPARDARHSGGEVAFVFGTERTGLENRDVQRCHHCCRISSDPAFSSLNLSQAVQVAAYEMRRALVEEDGVVPPRRDQTVGASREADPAASVEKTEALFRHLESGLTALGYLDPEQPRHLMARIRALLLRARPTTTEVDILRGVAAAMELPRTLRAGRKQEARGPGPQDPR